MSEDNFPELPTSPQSPENRPYVSPSDKASIAIGAAVLGGTLIYKLSSGHISTLDASPEALISDVTGVIGIGIILSIPEGRRRIRRGAANITNRFRGLSNR